MKLLLAILLLLPLSGCPCKGDDCLCHGYCPGKPAPKTYGVHMEIEVQPGAKASQADIEVTITRPSYVYNATPPNENKGRQRTVVHKAVSKHDRPYDEEVELKLHWSCPTMDKAGEVKVKIAADSATGKLTITDLPAQPPLTVYPWEFKRGLECIVITDDEKLAQEKKKQEQQDNGRLDDKDKEEEKRDKYRGSRAFFIKKSAPEIKLSQVALEAGAPDSYADIKVELLRDGKAVVAGDRSYDLEVEVKLPWSCQGQGIATPYKSSDTHIVIPKGESSGEARLIMPAQRSEVRLKCELDASAYIDSYLIGNSSESLEIRIPAAS